MSNDIKKKFIWVCFIMLALLLVGCDKEKVDEEVQWALGEAGIDLPERTSIKLSDNNNVICIVDSKIDASCELFSGIWENDIVSSSSFVGTSHGMYVAGIICSNADKDEYVSVLNNAKLYYIEIDSEEIDISQLITELKNAQEAGAKVVNCSFVTTQYYEELYEYIRDSEMLFVCASGNNHQDEILYPAAFELDNVISVAGTNRYGVIGEHSNFSADIDIAAPGEDILCVTSEKGVYENVSGSSLATAYVTSACAYIINEMGCSAKETKEILLNCCDEWITLDGKVKGNKTLSFEGIINYLQSEK